MGQEVIWYAPVSLRSLTRLRTAYTVLISFFISSHMYIEQIGFAVATISGYANFCICSNRNRNQEQMAEACQLKYHKEGDIRK